jgi:uncharacterized membrane protein (UPF0136 family)
MHRQIYQKILFHLSLLGIVASILVNFYDVILASVLEFLHIILEVIEQGLDGLVEKLFETKLHETQMIVFYILLVIGGFFIYFVWKVFVQLFSGVSHNFSNDWLELRAAIATDWGNMSMTNRVIFIAAFLLVNYLAVFLLF